MRVARFMPAIVGLSVWGLVLWGDVRAGVIINEVLANEPLGYVTLEWIELYNDSTAAVALDGYQLTVNGSPVALSDSLDISAGGYLIICRRLYTDGSSRGFEDYWGDSSGVWGDTPQESLLPTPFETGLILTNTNGTVKLLDGSGMSISQLSWTIESADGVSWERLSPASAEVEQSIDSDGSTPGMVNSWTPVPFDLALEDISVRPQNGAADITFTVTNRGLETTPNSQLIISTDTVSDSATLYQIIDSIDTGELLPGDTFTTARQYYLDGVYARLSASLSNDDRERNNHSDFVAPGVDFPSIILSEILADHELPLRTEWVEIKNSSTDIVNLAGYLLGDSRVLRVVADMAVLIEPGEYFILVQDSVAFHDFYSQFDGRCLQPLQWPPFNDNDDLVRLVDSFGFTADSFAYADTYGSNYTWSRSNAGERESEWGRSEQVGGSPGRLNAVLLQPEVSDLAVTVEPAVFSPDGDGVQDEVTIVVTSAPTETDLSIRIYDRQGRVVRTLVEEERLLKDSYTWNGRSDGNRRLPVGIYILYVEASGWGAVKKPLVIAR
ncbi:MAG: lamin tail domain-containing protein [bacterium]